MKLHGLMVTLGSQGDQTSKRVLTRVWHSVCLALGPGAGGGVVERSKERAMGAM